jgi:hypothetical protein
MGGKAMIQYTLHHLVSIERYGIASLCVFGFIFVSVLVWALCQRRSHLDYMARVPLESESEDPGEGE